MKSSRQKIILDIITNSDVETQNQLIEALNARGIASTQATISRDIKDLRLVKELTPAGTYRYAVSPTQSNDHNEKLRKIFRESVTSYCCAQNIVVLKTLPGLAPAACSAIDKMEIEGLAGTLAGDDTAFLAMVDNLHAQMLSNEIEEYF